MADVDYKSTKEDRAHMCGHDGHCAWLLGAASKILDNIDKIPSDKTVRLFFQPAEEALGGAYPMVQEGCLEGVKEVYGAHCEPFAKTGKLFVIEGPIQAQITEINITVCISEIDCINLPLDFRQRRPYLCSGNFY